jgi:putative colanic acid biosysnthesis UDP-glucose lipid carrier transferase
MLTPISKAADFLCISGAAYISKSIIFRDSTAFTHIDGLVGLLGLTLPFLTFRLTKVYKPFRSDSTFGAIVRVLFAWLFAQLVLVAISQPYPDVDPRNRWLLWWTAIAFCALVIGRCAIRALPTMLGSWRFAPTRVAIIAPRGAKPDLLARIASLTRDTLVPQVIFDPFLPGNTVLGQIRVVHEMNVLTQILRMEKIRELWIINPPFQPISVEHLFETFRNDFVNIRVLPVQEGSTSGESVIDIYRGVPVLNVMATSERGWSTLSKEIFDRVFALCVLLAISPILLAISVAVRLSSPGPIFFRQRRKGMNGEVFSIYKFRTMYQGSDKPGTIVQARKGDTRVTRIGRILRSTSLDELPQFLNVLKGEMSVVGPRPHAVEHDEHYKDLVEHYIFRYRIKPGITGWAQVNGHRGETVQIEKMEARVKFDLYYIQNWTFWMDVKIIALTILKGFVGKSAY